MSGASNRPSRRGVLTTAGAGAVVVLSGSSAQASSAASATRTGSAAKSGTNRAGGAGGGVDAGTSPLLLTNDVAVHLSRRLTYGPTPALLAHIRAIGVDAFIEEQLKPDAVNDYEAEAVAQTFFLLNEPNASNVLFTNGLDPMPSLLGATLFRRIWSQRQLFEVMVEFWGNHFNINYAHRTAKFYKNTDDRDVTRAHAMGRFADHLLASAKSPAMLAYLDNWISDAKNVNENYGRELLELHTVGVHGGYTEADVRNAAYVLTGWTIDTTQGTFSYNAAMHYVGPVKVMGWRHPNPDQANGQAVGESLIDYLAHHPSTARFLATKLCQRFVSDVPPASLVASAAQVYLANDTQIVPVLRHIFASKAFRTSQGKKHRRPHEIIASAVRALQLGYGPFIGPSTADGLRAQADAMGELPFGHLTPDGYADTADDWLSTAAMLVRWNFMQALIAGQVNTVQAFNSDTVVGTPVPATAGALVQRLSERILGQGLPGAHRDTVLWFISKANSSPVTTADVQSLAPQIAALLLSSPYAQVR